MAFVVIGWSFDNSKCSVLLHFGLVGLVYSGMIGL